MRQVINSLSTTKYTKVLVEGDSDIRFDAPHTFRIVKADDNSTLLDIHFQEGAIKECGVNGVPNEDLIVMVLERLYYFQRSLFKCKENDIAIEKLEEALMWLRKRTQDRELRGVEGTHTI